MESDEGNTPQHQQEEGDAHTGGKKKCSSKSDSLIPLSHSSRKAERLQVQCKLYELQYELEKLKMEAEHDSEKSLTERDQDLRDQFLDGLFDLRLQQKIYEDETDRNFCEVLYRAQELELIQKNSEERRGPLLQFFRDVRSTDQR